MSLAIPTVGQQHRSQVATYKAAVARCIVNWGYSSAWVIRRQLGERWGLAPALRLSLAFHVLVQVRHLEALQAAAA